MSEAKRKIRVGRVVSDKMDKTVTVVVDWKSHHQLYRKSMPRQSRFYAADPQNRCQMGDVVRIVESRPLSKSKRWRVVEILVQGKLPDVKPEEIGSNTETSLANPTVEETS